MDAILGDELLDEIFRRLPPASSSAVTLVSKRWLRVYRSSKTCLSLRLSIPYSSTPLLSFLSHFPFLSSLSLTAGGDSSDRLILSAASSCPNLRQLRLYTAPVSVVPLLSLSTSCPHLTSLSIVLSRPLSFRWLLLFHSLKELSVVLTTVAGGSDSCQFTSNFQIMCGDFDAELELESLGLSGIQNGDFGLDWLWRSCKKLKKLQLRSCECICYDDSSLSSFVNCLNGLQEVELRACRAIVDEVLSNLAQSSASLKSLLVYDGGSRDGLLQFITQSQCNLQKLDLRLPLDLDNDHLFAVADNFRGLSCLKLQSCCFVTGEGIKAICIAMKHDLEELALINCDVVEREPGLLTTLGQNLRRLRTLDLSYNEMLVDKEFTSMIVSCSRLRELKLRGCKRLTNLSTVSMVKHCRHLESVDIMLCSGIEAEAVELLVLNSLQLREVQVEESKLSDVARKRAANRLI
ncbi:uncharacterized protein LOC127803389 [Diospyros lotus]|uniref:uncharacterized protein LOC127803389 n=1 Tax=Diospyros lotus TaxID=55363 RepID=UPI00225C3B49|nr:uncharacterized protein LOC127803389 [Diospyros lotus]